MTIQETPPGTDFPDSVKLEARRLAFFRCCYCHDKPGDQVHHLTPKEEGGHGVLENAILLCVQCHADYGHRADKRRQLREARDHWYEIVAKRYAPTALAQVEKLDELATKNDIAGLRTEIKQLVGRVMVGIDLGTTPASLMANIGSTMVNSLTANPVVGVIGITGHAPKPVVSSHCRACGSEERVNAMFCSTCGERMRD